MKICKVCGKSYDNFPIKNKCRSCYAKEYYRKDPKKEKERQVKYRNDNRELVLQKKKEFYLKNRERLIKDSLERHHKNKEHNNARCRKYYQDNRQEQILRVTNYQKIKLQTDPYYRLIVSLRKAKNKHHSRIIKNAHIKDLLNADEQTFLNHISSLFQEGMTWDNYGKNGWVLDHIVPIDYFDLNDSEQVKICWHYLNLQPLWASVNSSKGSIVPINYLEIIDAIKNFQLKLIKA